jgi:C_GCAxxG_C_C family probable redox protein
LSLKEYLKIEDSLLPGLATGFGGGIGRKGSLCGAFTGSIMAIGMKMGRTDPNDKETLLKVYEKCQEFWEKFAVEFGSRECFTLTGYHFDDPEEHKKWATTGGREKCADIVAKTAQMLCEFIQGS